MDAEWDRCESGESYDMEAVFSLHHPHYHLQLLVQKTPSDPRAQQRPAHQECKHRAYRHTHDDHERPKGGSEAISGHDVDKDVAPGHREGEEGEEEEEEDEALRITRV